MRTYDGSKIPEAHDMPQWFFWYTSYATINCFNKFSRGILTSLFHIHCPYRLLNSRLFIGYSITESWGQCCSAFPARAFSSGCDSFLAWLQLPSFALYSPFYPFISVCSESGKEREWGELMGREFCGSDECGCVSTKSQNEITLANQ